jgi:hypothetical protein
LTAGQDISCDLLQPRPRNLTGSNRRLRKDKRQKTNMQKAGVRWAGHLDGDTQQPCPPPESLLCTVANKEVEQKFWWGGSGNRRNLRSLFSEHKYLRKISCAAFCPCLLLWLGLCQLNLQIIGHSCAMSSSHRLLRLCSPHLPLFYFLNAPDDACPPTQGVVFALCGIQLKEQENR